MVQPIIHAKSGFDLQQIHANQETIKSIQQLKAKIEFLFFFWPKRITFI